MMHRPRCVGKSPVTRFGQSIFPLITETFSPPASSHSLSLHISHSSAFHFCNLVPSLKSLCQNEVKRQKTASMSKLFLIIALCVLPSLAAATRPMRTPFTVEGKVYCDTCRAGYETKAITYIAGAKVRLECRDKNSMALLYTKEGTTDSAGCYKIPVAEDHLDQFCDAVLVSSPQKDCATVSPGRERARVILTANNGIASYNRFANAMGFMRTEALSGCTQILKEMQELDE